jgi:Tfp pilus assembly protein PilF
MEVEDKNPAAARALVDTAVKSAPKRSDLKLIAGTTYLQTSDIDQAEKMLRDAIDLDPNNFEAYVLLGRVYTVQKRLSEAAVEFDQLAQRHGNAAGPRTVVGILMQLQNKIPEATAQYEKALSSDPRAAVAANNLAWLYAQQGDKLEEALQLAQTAKSVLPQVLQVSDTLGWVYYKKGLGSLAVPLFLECVQKQPRSAEFQYHLGMAYVAQGDVPKGRAALERAVSLDPKLSEVADVKQVLISGKGE